MVSIFQIKETNRMGQENPLICCLRETHLSFKVRGHFGIKGWEKYSNQMGLGNEIGFTLKLIREDKEGYFVLTKETVNQEDTTILNIRAPDSGAPSSFKNVLLELKTEKNINPFILSDFTTPLFPVDRSSGQKLNKIVN